MKSIIILLSAFVLFFSCLPDRSPTAPLENKRPEFKAFDSLLAGAIDAPLDQPVSMNFNEKMDLNTFRQNFSLESISGEISGSFEYAATSDSTIIFKPSGQLNPAEVYWAKLSAYVRDANGNSIIPPNETDIEQSIWFFTTGSYAENGYPYVFIRDKVDLNKIYLVHEVNTFKDSIIVTNAEDDIGTAEMEVNRDLNKLFMVNLKVAGTVSVLSLNDFSVEKIIPVGVGPTAIAFTGSRAFVANNSGKTLSVIDLAALEVTKTIDFSDGYKPQDIVYSNASGKCYMYSKTSSIATKIKVLDTQNADNLYDIDDVLESKVIDIDVTPDGSKVVFVEDRSSRIYVMDTATETAEIVETGYPNNLLGAIDNENYYLAFKQSGADGAGGIAKINLSTLSIDELLLLDPVEDKQITIDDLAITDAGELLYAVVSQDTTVKIIETSTLSQISQAKVKGNPRSIALTQNNF
ncbi:MAG: YncE family protein [Calditrichaeota bacterium]|nr:YncE family protein [Calditrichota bacterium]